MVPVMVAGPGMPRRAPAGDPASGPAVAPTPAGPPRWYAHPFNRAGFYRAAATAARVLPRPARLALARALAAGLSRRFPVERAVVRANLARIVPQAPPATREALAAALFRNFAVCFADLLTTNRTNREPWRLLAGVDGEACLRRALARDRGLVVLTAHLGNWEIGGRLLAQRLGRPTHVVLAAEADPGVERFLRGGPAPVRFVTRRRPTDVLPLVAALRRREIVAMQGDRALGGRADLPVPFFGVAAPFPLGPFVLARAAGAPIVPAFCLLDADGRYRVRIGAEIEVERGGETTALAAWVAVLEREVREHPTQWFNFFDAWRSDAAP